MLSVLALLVLAGCGLLPSIAQVAVWNPVWSRDGWVYFLREEDSGGVELWRQRQRGQPELVELKTPGVCQEASMRFLFPVPDRGVGIGVECDGGTGTQIFLHVPPRGSELVTTLDWVSSAALRRDGRTGFVELATECGSSIAEFGDGGRMEVLQTDGSTGPWRFVSRGTGEDCANSMLSGAPVMAPDGERLFFVASPESVGKMPLSRGDLEEIGAGLYLWQKGLAEDPQRICDLPAPADLAVAPDGQTVAAAVDGRRESGVFLVETLGGGIRRIVDGGDASYPAFSPDGQWLAYVNGLKDLRFVRLYGQ